MILPRFTLRATLAGVTACALMSLVLARALMGDLWAIAASVAVGSLLAIIFIHGILYVVIAALAGLLGSHTLPARTRQGSVQASPDEHYLPGTTQSSS